MSQTPPGLAIRAAGLSNVGLAMLAKALSNISLDV